MRTLKRRLTRLWTFLVYGGTGRLRTYEQLILQRVSASLSPADAAALKAQMDSLDHLKRLHKDRMVSFYFFDRERLPRIENRDEARRLATYRVSGGSINATVAVFSHRGLLFSFDFSKSPTALEGKDVLLEPVDGKQHPRTVAEEADREEHGDEDRDS